jgi:nitrite reductase (NADH) large subunit
MLRNDALGGAYKKLVLREGLDAIKKKVVEDAANRKALYARLQYALEGEPDPWKERAAGKDGREYEPLAVEQA